MKYIHTSGPQTVGAVMLLGGIFLLIIVMSVIEVALQNRFFRICAEAGHSVSECQYEWELRRR